MFTQHPISFILISSSTSTVALEFFFLLYEWKEEDWDETRFDDTDRRWTAGWCPANFYRSSSWPPTFERERERKRECLYWTLPKKLGFQQRYTEAVCLEAFPFDIYMSSCCSRVHIHLLVIYCRSLHKRIIPRQQTIYTAAACWARVLSYFIYVYIFDPPTPHSAIYCDVLLVVVPSPLPVSVQHSKYKESMV